MKNAFVILLISALSISSSAQILNGIDSIHTEHSYKVLKLVQEELNISDLIIIIILINI